MATAGTWILDFRATSGKSMSGGASDIETDRPESTRSVFFMAPTPGKSWGGEQDPWTRVLGDTTTDDRLSTCWKSLPSVICARGGEKLESALEGPPSDHKGRIAGYWLRV